MIAQLTIIPNCLLLVHYLANKTDDPDAAFSAGLVALVKSIKHFNPHKGANFLTYAFIAIQRAIRRQIPEKRKLAKQMKFIQHLYFQRTGKHLSPERLAALLQEDEAKIRDLLVLDNTISIEELRKNDDQEPILIDKNISLPEEIGSLEKSFVAEAVENVLQSLSADEKQIIDLYYGFEGDSYTQPQIASMFNVSSEAIRKKINKILEKLSANRRLKVLAEAEV